MEEREESQRLQSSFGASPSTGGFGLKQQQQQQTSSINRFELPHLNTSSSSPSSQVRLFSPNFSQENNKRPAGIPPSHPHMPPVSPFSQIPVSRSATHNQPNSQNFSPGPSHSRSLSQPAFFSFDSLPPLSPSPSNYREPNVSGADSIPLDVSMDDRDGGSQPFSRNNNSLRFGESSQLPPRRGHRRSSSDIPFGYSTVIQSSPPLIPSRGAQGSNQQAGLVRENSISGAPIQLVKQESEWERNSGKTAEGMGERKSEGEVIDDLFTAYLNLENVDLLNSCGTKGKSSAENRDDLDSRTSGTKMSGGDSSDNETESSANESGCSMPQANFCSSNDRKDASKRSAGEDIAPANRHRRSVSMDSFMGNLPNFGDESPNLPNSQGVHSSMDGTSSNFSLDFANGEFTSAELKKIMANDKLAEIASTDPKRAKRILANRQSAARSKERKLRYISELEHKVQTLQTEATTLSAQLTLLQRDSSGLTSENNELKFRIQAMEQQAHLRDALNDALTAEVQRLKIATGEMRGGGGGGEVPNSNRMAQLTMNAQMFQLQQKQQQQTQLNTIFQLQQQQQQQKQPLSPNSKQQQNNSNQ